MSGGATVYKFGVFDLDSRSVSNTAATGPGKPIAMNDCRNQFWLVESADGTTDVTSGTVVIETANEYDRAGKWTVIESLDLATLYAAPTAPFLRDRPRIVPGIFIRANVTAAPNTPINVIINGLLG